ncbi:MAG: FeoA family protein [Candidatus Nezhaarchaeales archaeon]
MSIRGDVLFCTLEVVMTLRKRGLHPNDSLIAEELRIPLNEVKQLMEEAVKQGFVVKKNDYYDLTEEGLKEVIRHRERFIHDRFVHGDSRWSSGITNWYKHWRQKHGLTRGLLTNFYNMLTELEGRVEDLKPLSEMRPGERGIIVSIACGLGAARRVAEMGLTPGVEVLVTRRAPLRGPIEVEVRDTRVVLGYGLASKIAVKVVRAS